MANSKQDGITVGVVGLGSMGFGIAKSLLAAGFQTFGFDLSDEAVARFVDLGGLQGDFGSAPVLDVAVLVVVNAEQAEAVLFGNSHLVSNLRDDSVVVGCMTVAPAFALATAAKLRDGGVHYLDAPISGGSQKAAAGALSIIASGSPAAFAKAQPVIDAMSDRVFKIGDEPGLGSAMKAVNQLLAGVHIAAMAEAITFGMSQGLSPEQIVEVISECAGASWMFRNRSPHIVEGNYTPRSTIDIWPKDLGIVLDMARAASFSAPMASTALQQFVATSGMGFGQEDDAAIAKFYARNANLRLPGEGKS